MSTLALPRDTYRPSAPMDPQGMNHGAHVALAPGAGRSLWSLADSFRGFHVELNILNASDRRFLERANRLVDAVRAAVPKDKWADLGVSPLEPITASSVESALVLVRALGPELACALLVRAGLLPRFAGSVIAEAVGEPLWGETADGIRRRRDMGTPMNLRAVTPVEQSIDDRLPGAAMAAQLRLIAGFERDWVAMPSEMIGMIWGVSVAFESGLPEGIAGRVTQAWSLGFEAEIVLDPANGNPERTLGCLLAAWLAMKSEGMEGGVFSLAYKDLEERPDLETPAGTYLAAADWLVMSPQRLLEELRRIGSGGLEERSALIAMDLYLPVDQVLSACRMLYRDVLSSGLRI